MALDCSLEMMKLDERISNMLLQMGATPDLLGFRYIKECVILALKKRGKVLSIIKDLYDCIAAHNNVTTESVERTIRHTIDIIWDKGKIDVMNKCLGMVIFSAGEKPTSGQFIMIIAEKLSHEFYFDDEGNIILLKIK